MENCFACGSPVEDTEDAYHAYAGVPTGPDDDDRGVFVHRYCNAAAGDA